MRACARISLCWSFEPPTSRAQRDCTSRSVIEFGREQHETGPEHWSTTLECGTVIELYPTSVQPQGAQPRLGFVVNDLALTRDAFLTAGGSVVTDDGAVVVVEDLDGRRIELTGS